MTDNAATSVRDTRGGGLGDSGEIVTNHTKDLDHDKLLEEIQQNAGMDF